MTSPGHQRPHPEQRPGPPPAGARASAAMPAGVPASRPPEPALPVAPAHPGGAPAVPSPATAAAGAAAVPAPAQAIAAPAALPIPAPPEEPPAGDSDGPGPPAPEQRWRARQHRRLSRLRIGYHAAPVDDLDQLQLRRGSVGLRLGRNQAGEPVTLRLFRAQPTRAVLVGAGWAAELLTIRALRFGARAVVVTPDPAGWVELGRRATGRTDRMAVRAPGAEVGMAASADTPVLRVTGAGPVAAEQLPTWTTRLSVLPPATVSDLAIRPDRAAHLTVAEIVLLQRLAPREAAAVAAVLRLPPPVSEALTGLPDGVLAVLGRTGVHYAFVELTDPERDTLSTPR